MVGERSSSQEPAQWKSSRWGTLCGFPNGALEPTAISGQEERDASSLHGFLDNCSVDDTVGK